SPWGASYGRAGRCLCGLPLFLIYYYHVDIKVDFAMLLKYKYKLKPHKRQGVIIANWLELARRQYNYRLAERLNWFEATRTPVNACPLNVSVVPVERIYQNIPEFRVQRRDGRKKDSDGNSITRKGDKHPNLVNGYVLWETVQLADLTQTKKLFPEYKSMHSQVLQDVIQRVQTTMDNLCLT
ncbi:helix-turn-helix domain-containing protein, partial [Dapis sp. BLCC M126]|uniref:helix-turn-helix domain-containing protein n=1 Tax=Dapis sp. BLCC M126 TaxID=3400189 RepID=UPI003CEED32E